MTAARRAVLTCDGVRHPTPTWTADCGRTLTALDDSTVPQLRVTARGKGWVRRGGQDLCEDCAEPEAGRRPG